MANRRIYAGYYRRYDGKIIYVVTTAKDSDTNEEMVIWTPSPYAEKRSFFTMSKVSFCEDVVVDGKPQPKFTRQTRMKLSEVAAERYEEEGLRGPIRREHISEEEDEYDEWWPLHPDSYYEYAKRLCERYRFSRAKYALCVREKRYIGVRKEDFRELTADLSFLENCLKTVLQDYADYFRERFVEGLSIRKYAQAHDLNRGSVDHLQRKFFTALGQALKERDEAEGRSRLLRG